MVIKLKWVFWNKLSRRAFISSAQLFLPRGPLYTAILLPPDWKTEIFSSNSLGIALGLVLGKPLGIAGFSALGIAFGVAKLPEGMNTIKLIGLGLLAGIGFTMSIFISNLAFSSNDDLINSSKVAVLFASLIAAVLGWIFLRSGAEKAEKIS